MARYVALLRGVNVNGITIRSAELAGLFRELGFSRVETILGSGNVLFDAHGGDLKEIIEGGLRSRFDYDAWIVLRRQAEMAAIAEVCPFAAESEELHAYVVFGSHEGVLAELAGSPQGLAEGVVAGDGVLYWQVARGQTLETPFAKQLGKARFKRHITTRNLRTVVRLAEAL